MSIDVLQALPPAIHLARESLTGLAALLRIVDPAAFRSLGGPEASAIGALLLTVAGKYDEGLADLGLEPPVPD